MARRRNSAKQTPATICTRVFKSKLGQVRHSGPHSGKSEVYLCPIASYLQRRIAVSVPGLDRKHIRIVRYSSRRSLTWVRVKFVTISDAERKLQVSVQELRMEPFAPHCSHLGKLNN